MLSRHVPIGRSLTSLSILPSSLLELYDAASLIIRDPPSQSVSPGTLLSL